MVEAEAQKLLQVTYGFFISRALIDLADMGVADALGETSESSEVLAQRIGAHPDALRRVLRLVAAQGVFREESAGRFAHTKLSRLLRSDHPHSVRDMIRANLAWKVASELETTLRTGQPAPSFAAPGGLFEYLANNPDEARRFDQSMTSKANRDLGALLAAYPFSSFKLIVDVGGGQGRLLKAILAAAPGSHGILFDRPQVVADVAAGQRLSIQAGDFFKDALPAADAYLLMNVIHDWNDPEARAILEAVRRAAPVEAKLLLVESIMPEKVEPSAAGYRALMLDVAMLAMTGGRERTLSEYGALLAQAGFSLDRVVSTSGELSVIESSVPA